MLSTDKSVLRKHFADLRKSIPNKKLSDEKIFQKLIQHPKILAATHICVYISYHEEVDTHAFINWAVSAGKTVAVPKVNGSDLRLYQLTSLSECVPGFKGILEPTDTMTIINPHSIDVFVLLGLAFDASGYRLGYGKGFTDRMLAPLTAYTIGVGYTDQLVYELPRTEYDVPVNEVITDSVSLII